MRVRIDAAPGEIRERSEDLAKAIAGVVDREGGDPRSFLRSFVEGVGADLDLIKALPLSDGAQPRSKAMRTAVDGVLDWYTDVLLPSMIDQIDEALR